jgi:hypothetical protein
MATPPTVRSSGDADGFRAAPFVTALRRSLRARHGGHVSPPTKCIQEPTVTHSPRHPEVCQTGPPHRTHGRYYVDTGRGYSSPACEIHRLAGIRGLPALPGQPENRHCACVVSVRKAGQAVVLCNLLMFPEARANIIVNSRSGLLRNIPADSALIAIMVLVGESRKPRPMYWAESTSP